MHIHNFISLEAEETVYTLNSKAVILLSATHLFIELANHLYRTGII